MITDEQKQILDSFQNLISDCLAIIKERHNINGCAKNSPDWCKESIPAIEIRISESLEAFNDEYDWQREIEKSIEGKPNEEIHRYIYDILCYFSEFSNAYYPYALVDRWNNYICDYKKKINIHTEEKQKENYNKLIDLFEKQIRQVEEAETKYEDIALTFQYKGIADECFRLLVCWERCFANILDAVLAKRGIDLMQLQKQAGIYIKSRVYSTYTRATDIMDFVGSFDLAKYYISVLHRQASGNEYSEKLKELFHGHTNLIDELVGKSDREIAFLIKKWSKQKDDNGNPLIENPSNRLQKSFAEELRQNNLIKLSIESFRKKL